MFHGDWMKSKSFTFDIFVDLISQDYEIQIPTMLAGGIRVLLYAGEDDYICNYLGNKVTMMVSGAY